MFSKHAINYAWRQLASRAGINLDTEGRGLESLGIHAAYEVPNDRVPDRPSLHIIPCRENAWNILLERPKNSLDWIPMQKAIPQGTMLPFKENLPVLFWGKGFEEGSHPFAELHESGRVVFYVDIIASTLYMLTRWEETVIDKRDLFDRFPAEESASYKQGFLDRPIIDQYAMILRKWIKVLVPRWEPEYNNFSIKLSHDIDRIKPFKNEFHAVRTLAGYLLKHHDLREAAKTVQEYFNQQFLPRKTEFMKGIDTLVEISREFGFGNDVFYFMTGLDDYTGAGYSLENKVITDTISYLQKEGFEIGIHTGYDSYLDLGKLSEEKERMDAILEKPSYGGRQHFLRFNVPQTWRNWETVGFEYDSTMGYAGHEGFRCGTCHPFHPFDLEQNREIDLIEIPLIAMDVTLKHYRKMSVVQAKQRILVLAASCKAVGGIFTFLWHNSSFCSEWKDWGMMYRNIIGELKDL